MTSRFLMLASHIFMFLAVYLLIISVFHTLPTFAMVNIIAYFLIVFSVVCALFGCILGIER